MKKREYNYVEQASKTLWQLSSFKWTIRIIPVFSFVVTLFILYNDNLKFDTTYEGWNNLIIIFRIPLGILALIIPTVAAIASNHRSLQSKVQIELQDTQNKFSNYYKHKEEFQKYLAIALTKEVITKYNIHSILFPSCLKGVYKIDFKKIKLVEDVIEHIIARLNNYSIKSTDENIKIIHSIDRSLSNLEIMIGLDSNRGKENNSNNRTFNGAGVDFIVRGGHLRGHLNSVKNRIENIKIIFEFDNFSVLPNNFNKILDLDFSSVPDKIDAMTLKDNNGFKMHEILEMNNVLIKEESK